jgi:hypothetical protein
MKYCASFSKQIYVILFDILAAIIVAETMFDYQWSAS